MDDEDSDLVEGEGWSRSHVANLFATADCDGSEASTVYHPEVRFDERLRCELGAVELAVEVDLRWFTYLRTDTFDTRWRGTEIEDMLAGTGCALAGLERESALQILAFADPPVRVAAVRRFLSHMQRILGEAHTSGCCVYVFVD